MQLMANGMYIFSIVALCCATTPWFLVVLPVLATLFTVIARYFSYASLQPGCTCA